MKKENVIIVLQVVSLNCLNPNQNMKVDRVGHLLLRRCRMYLTQKLTIWSVRLELSISVKSVEDTTYIFLMMDQSLLEKDIVTMVYV